MPTPTRSTFKTYLYSTLHFWKNCLTDMIYLICVVLASIVFGCNAYNSQANDGGCPSLMKAHFNQSDHDFFSPYIHYTRYKTNVPDLNSFTLSFWIKFDKLDQNATVFTYVECEYGPTLISVKYVHSPYLAWEVQIHEKKVLRPIQHGIISKGSWHHVLVSWSGKSSRLAFWLDNNHSANLYIEGALIPGGGVVRSGHSEPSIAYWDGTTVKDQCCMPKSHQCCDGSAATEDRQCCDAVIPGCNRRMQPDEGFNGWLTLLNFDSKPFAMGNSDDVKHRVSHLMSSCGSPHNRGNIIDWQSTPLKGYGSITTHLARQDCGQF